MMSERREYIPRAAILAEVEEALAHHSADEIDYISLVGSGEPTLHGALGWLIREIKQRTTIPVAVITNGALMRCADVRAELAAADVVMPTVSAGTADLYRRIHRPHPSVPFADMIDGLTAFRAIFRGQLWVEVMLIDGINDNEESLQDLKKVLTAIAPDQVHILLPDRPPAEPWVHPADQEGLLRAEAILGSIAHIVHPFLLDVHSTDYASPTEAVVSIVTRHPMNLTQLTSTLDCWSPEQVESAIAALEQAGTIRPVNRLGIRFWAASGSVFPN
jgi:wyosine [tRNA(Phe)-imidazoG37] synthetase (radical SAM superfamily)